MQYTARSFSQMLSERVLPQSLAPRLEIERPAGLFPAPGRLTSDCSDPLTRGVYEPFFDRWARRFQRLRWLQQGDLHAYLLYILFVVIAALGWSSVRWWRGHG